MFATAVASGSTVVFAASVSVLLLAGCGATVADRPTDQRLPVFAGIPPVAYLVEQIGGDHVKVDVLVQPGQDPHTFEPTPQQVLALSRAAVFFEVDMPFESVLLGKVLEGNRRLKVVDTTRGIEKRPMDAPCCEAVGGHDHAQETPGGAPDPHVWLSAPLLKTQAQNVAAALGEVDPAHDADYQRNLAALVDRLDAVHRRIRKTLEPYRARSFYVFHPGFGYFADAYGLKQEAVEAGGRSPTPKELRVLIGQIQAAGVKTIFAQPEFAPQSAQVVAEAIGGKVVPLNGLAKDVVGNLESIAEEIQQAFQGSPPRRHAEHGDKTK